MKFNHSIIVAIIIFVFPSSLLAHETKTIGSMSVLLHMEPQDSPVVNEVATLFFAITDSEKEFKTSLCNCTITIHNKDEKIFDTALTKEEPNFGSNVFSTQFSFPQKAVYTVTFTAMPIIKDKEIFEQFSTEYNVRVARTSINQNPVDPVVSGFLNLNFFIYLVGILSTLVILTIGLDIIKFKKK